MMSDLWSLCQDRKGATAIEYALIASLIFLAIVGAVTSLSDSVIDLFTTIAGALP